MIHPLQSVYDKIPKLVCAGYCGRDRWNSCCGPIGCTALEARLLEAFDGQATEWDGLKRGNVHMSLDALKPKGLACPHLGFNGRCTAYEVRPMICRLWGVDETLPCPWDASRSER